MADLGSPSHPVSTHRLHKREAMIARILETARAMMREEGVAALTMQGLARRLNLRAPSLYNYFSSRMDLFDTLFRYGYRLYGEHMAAYQAEDQPWEHQVMANMEGSLVFAMQNPELYQLCFQRPVPGFVPSEESLKVSFGELHRVYALVTRLLPQMDTNLTPERAGDLLIAMGYGLAALKLANEPEAPLGEGRFGSLIPVVIDVLHKAWSKEGLTVKGDD